MSGLAILLLGLALLACAGGVALTRWRREKRLRDTLATRLAALEPGCLRAEHQEKDWLSRTLAGGPPFLRIWLGRADVHPQGRFAVVLALGLLAATVAAADLGGPIGAIIVLAAGLVAPLAALYGLAAFRLKRFLDGLPYFLDAVRQLLNVGNSIQQALLKACDAASPAVQRYLQPAMRRIANGAPIPDAVTMAAERIATPELYMLATAVRTNIRFGGPISPILGEFADMLRDRARVDREIAAATSETRLSAVILCCLPLVAIALLSLVNIGYIRFLWEAELGRKLLMAAAALELTGMLVMRRLMRVDF
jgi:tight adherence protein B